MSSEITVAFVKQFSSNIFHLSQQKGSRLQPLVRNEMQKGDSAFYDRIGSVTASVSSGRHADTVLSDTPHSRRRVTMDTYRHADMVDNADKIKMLIDPTNAYVESFMWAFGRAKDDVIIAAALGSAYGGVAGATAVAHSDSQKLVSVASSAGANLNVQALRRAKKKFDEADVDESIPRYLVCEASQMESLLSATEVTSADFNSVRALVTGQVDTFLGFKFVRSQRLAVDSSGEDFSVTTGQYNPGGGGGTLTSSYRRCFAWAQDGLLLSTGEDVKSRVSERADKNYGMQVFAEMSLGATRMEEEKVVEILCLES
jgi:hypothetical protein